ncbi:MAG: hypothetical protein WC939_05375 [Acholeplasmataceae bacterium]
MTGPIIGIIIVALVISLYLVISYFNHKTPIPEGCEEAFNEAQGCTLCAQRKTCGLIQKLDNIKEIKL